MTNVLIVDDERIVQELFTSYIERANDRYNLIAKIKGAGNADVYCCGGTVDLVIMDICTANEQSGIEATKRIKKACPNIKVVIVTSAPDYRFIDMARAAGADSFWYKEFSNEELIYVMDRTMQGESIYPDRVPAVEVGNVSSDELTPKEKQVLYYIVQNKGLHEIAEIMGVEYTTVRTHVKNLKVKTGAKDLVGLCYLAAKSRLIVPEY